MSDDYTEASYGERIADVYDDRYGPAFEEDTRSAVSFLGELANGGPALELGIGTGRVALPLMESGTEVHGIDASAAMVERLRAKPGGRSLPVTIGSFAEFSLEERFPLILVVFNTFFALLTQEEQISCFKSVAEHLSSDGVFVMQAFVPDVTRFDAHNQRVSVDAIEHGELSLETSVHDPFHQRTDTLHVVVHDGKLDTYPVKIRYAYPSELDLMARLAGLRLRERWADWEAHSLSIAALDPRLGVEPRRWLRFGQRVARSNVLTRRVPLRGTLGRCNPCARARDSARADADRNRTPTAWPLRLGRGRSAVEGPSCPPRSEANSRTLPARW